MVSIWFSNGMGISIIPSTSSVAVYHSEEYHAGAESAVALALLVAFYPLRGTGLYLVSAVFGFLVLPFAFDIIIKSCFNYK